MWSKLWSKAASLSLDQFSPIYLSSYSEVRESEEGRCKKFSTNLTNVAHWILGYDIDFYCFIERLVFSSNVFSMNSINEHNFWSWARGYGSNFYFFDSWVFLRKISFPEKSYEKCTLSVSKKFVLRMKNVLNISRVLKMGLFYKICQNTLNWAFID